MTLRPARPQAGLEGSLCAHIHDDPLATDPKPTLHGWWHTKETDGREELVRFLYHF